MGLNNIVKSRGFRNFMAKLYGWGASVVILGALFKINHYQGADIMLIIGLGTESVIFFFSAFEPPHVEPDWSLVYPELAGMYHGIASETEMNGSTGELSGDLDKMLAEAKIGPELIESLGQGLRNLSENTSRLSDITNATVATSQYAENVKTASESVGKLNESYKRTTEILDKDAGVSQEYVSSVRNASASASNLSSVYNQVTESIKKDLSASGVFADSLKEATASVKDLSDKYSQSARIISKSADALDFSSLKESDYIKQLERISRNLTSLNSVYEMQLQNSKDQADTAGKVKAGLDKFLGTISGSIENTGQYQEKIQALNQVFERQLKGTEAQVDTTGKLQSSLDNFLTKLNDSADKTLKYNEELDNLAKKVSALNTVYGNMLSALNVKSEK
ncbi:MAG: gliding motility protein GldL [Bacteroidales bacterium]|nr:gliding motility protein GldL [Bacteroidales bacterium]